MKRPASPNITDDHPPLQRTRSNGEGIRSYTLTFAENVNIVFDQSISAKSNVLLNFDPDTPVPVQKFHVSSAHALIAMVTNTTEFPALTTEVFVMTVSLCNYLQMDTDVVALILNQLEPPSSEEDQLSRLRACHQTLPFFSTML